MSPVRARSPALPGNTAVVSELPKDARPLLAAAPGDFVDERNRLARQLRDDGRAEEAATVAALRKPPPVVLAANRAARSRPQAAKGAARAAQRAAKRLGSDAGAREELEEQLQLLEDVAIAFLGTDEKPASESARRRLHDLLRNAIADEGTRTALAEGMLAAEPDPVGFAAYAGIKPRERREGSGAGASKARAGRREQAERRREQARLEALGKKVAAAEELVEAATRAEDEAMRAREAAERELESAQAELERAQRSS
jgi:hypothetical protein